MKRKSVAALCLAGCMVTTGLTGCGTGGLTKNVAEAVAEQQGNEDKVVEKDVQEKSVEEDQDEEDQDKEDQDEEDQDEEDQDEEDQDEEDQDEEDQDEEDQDEEDQDEDDQDEDNKDEDDKKDSKKSTSNKGLGEKYVDFDNMVFDINGKVYQLGKTTWAEMIEDGVPFRKDDIANAQNNINSNSKSQTIGITLGEYYTTYVSVGNYTDDNKTLAECPIVELYFPVNLEKEQDIITLPFPLELTEDELTEHAGEPTIFDTYENVDRDEDEMKFVQNTYEYETESEKYLRKGGYKFEFINGELEYITIDWIP